MTTILTYRMGHDVALGECIIVDAQVTDCGKVFHDVARILNLDNPNPMIEITNPLGVSAVAQVVERAKALGKEAA